MVGLSVDFFLVAAPPPHTTLITAKPLRLLLGNLNDFSSAKITSCRGQGVFVPADKRFDCIALYAHFLADGGIAHSHGVKLKDTGFLLVGHHEKHPLSVSHITSEKGIYPVILPI